MLAKLARIWLFVLNVSKAQISGKPSLSNLARTVLSRMELFFPVRGMRWEIAQRAEGAHYAEAVHKGRVGLEAKKAKTLFETFENTLGLDLRTLLEKRHVLDVACGPESAIAGISGVLSKFGLEPYDYGPEVQTRYDSLGFRLIKNTAEDFRAINYPHSADNPMVILYHPLQHLYDPEKSLSRLATELGMAELIDIDYINVPADDAHPQILTARRLRKMLSKLDPAVRTGEATVNVQGLVEGGNGRGIRVFSVYAKLGKVGAVA